MAQAVIENCGFTDRADAAAVEGDDWVEDIDGMVAVALDAALAFRPSDVCPTCQGDPDFDPLTEAGNPSDLKCPQTGCSDGRVPREFPRLAILREQVVRSAQPPRWDEPEPAFTLLPEGEHQL